MQSTDRIVPISIAMPVSMAQRIRVLAAQEDKSRSQFVRELLEEALPSDGAAQRHGPREAQDE